MKYKVTAKVIDIVEALYAEGFSGEIKLDNSYATGTREVLGQAVSVIIPGFCKESLHLVEDIEAGKIVGVGRYSVEFTEDEVDVKFLVNSSWRNYKYYQARGYSRPYEFEKLYYKYGYLKDEIITQKVVKEL